MKPIQILAATLLLFCTAPTLSAQIDLNAATSEAAQLLQAKEFDKAAATLEQAIKRIKGTPQETEIPALKTMLGQTYASAGITKSDAGQYEEGQLYLKKALEAVPQGSDLWNEFSKTAKTYRAMHCWDKQKNVAKALSSQERYDEAIAVYEEIIDSVKGTRIESMTDALKDAIAICHLKKGTVLFKAAEHEAARRHYELAIANSREGSDVYLRAYSMLGLWYGTQALNLLAEGKQSGQILSYFEQSEFCYAKAGKTDRQLKERVNRASALADLNRNNEAKELLNSVLQECAQNETLRAVRGSALYELGKIEADEENLKAAIDHLVEAYELLKDEAKTTIAYRAALRLQSIYSSDIPDKEKERFWEEKSEQLSHENAQ